MKRGFLKGSKTKARPLYPSSEEEKKKEKKADPVVEAKPAVKKSAPPAATPNNNRYRLPYGKAENNDPLGGIAVPPVSYTEVDASKPPDQPDATVIMTTVPPMVRGGQPDPDGHTEWITTPNTKKRVLATPDHPLAPLRVRELGEAPAYEVRATRDDTATDAGTDMGLGVFATRDIKVGELIIAERPLLVLPANIARLAPGVGGGDWAGTLQQCEVTLEVALGRMGEERREAFRALGNTHGEDGSGPLLGVVRTNGYRVDALYDGEEVLEYGRNAYSAVCEVGARINHSCMPNVDNDFSLDSFSFGVGATRDIKAGEQLFQSYCPIDLPLAERKAALAPYGFTCTCTACAHATPASDTLREEHKQRIGHYFKAAAEWTKAKRVPQATVDEILEFDKALVAEGLDGTEKYGVLVNVLFKMYLNLGQEDKARECVRQMQGRDKLLI